MKLFWKWAIGVAAGLTVILIIGNWYATHRLKPSMEAELKERVVTDTDGRYRLAYDRLDVSLLSGSATATDIRLLPDTSADAQEQQPSTAAPYRIRIGRLQIKGAGLLRYLLTDNLHINTITLDTPSVHIIRNRQADTAAVDTTAGSFFGRLAETLSGTRVKRIVLNAGRFEMEGDADASRLHIQHINATARDIRIDSVSLLDTARLFYTKAIRLEVDSISYLRPDSLYLVQAGPLRFDTDARELELHGLRYALTVSKAEFYRQVQRAEDIGDIAISRINLVGINVPSWVKSRAIAASTLHIDSGSIAVYKDKTQPNPPENKIGKSPHQQLLRLKQPLTIDSLLLNAIDISFTEVSDQTAKAGTVTFESTNGVIRNVTNDSLALTRNRFMQLHATSRVMGAGDLDVEFRFDLLDSLGAHTYKAHVGAMNGAAFNNMLTPQLNVEIERAAIGALSFEMEADDRHTKGTLRLEYSGLKVNMLKADDDGGMTPKPVVSFFANRFLLNDSNPDANGVYHTGQVYIQRPDSFSFFKMIWRSIREGTKACIGL